MSFFIDILLFAEAAGLFDVEGGSESCDGFFLGFRRAFALEVKHCKLYGIAVWDCAVKEMDLCPAAWQLDSRSVGLFYGNGDDCAVSMNRVRLWSSSIRRVRSLRQEPR